LLVFEAKTVLLNYVGRKALPRASITHGRKSFWKPVRNGLPLLGICFAIACQAVGDTAREANTDEVKGLRKEARDLKEVVAEQALELRLLKKSIIADGGDEE